MSDSHTPSGASARLNTGVAHNARVWNYWIGGKDNYEVDQRVGDHVASINPVVRDIARADRDFLGRAVAYLTGERGVRQHELARGERQIVDSYGDGHALNTNLCGLVVAFQLDVCAHELSRVRLRREQREFTAQHRGRREDGESACVLAGRGLGPAAEPV